MTRHGWLLVWGAVVIFAASNAVVRLLHEVGAAHPIEGRNAISFCNVLFVGNLCAALTIAVVYRRSWTAETMGRLSRGDWISLAIVAPLSSALAPALIFLALETTTVTNVVLVGRIEPPLFLAFSALLLGERPDRWTLLGAAVSFVGVVVMLALQSSMSGVMFGRGEVYAALGALILAGSTVLSKKRLKTIPVGVFMMFRTTVGTIFFFFAAAYLFGIGHFMDAFSPFLWQWMVVYGALIVVGGQFLWFTGLPNSRSSDVSLATSFSPVFGVLFAFALLGERPGFPELIGGLVILGGIAIAQFGQWRHRRAAARQDAAVETATMECRVGFKGV